MFNTYTEEFRRNAVAVVCAGYGIANLAKRLHVPPSSIRNWVGNPRYSDIEPADEELLKKLSFPEEKRYLNRFSVESMISVLKMSTRPSES